MTIEWRQMHYWQANAKGYYQNSQIVLAHMEFARFNNHLCFMIVDKNKLIFNIGLSLLFI